MEGAWRDHGIKFGGATHLIQIRFADDLMLYAKSWHELGVMLESLKVELALVSWFINECSKNSHLHICRFTRDPTPFTEI